MVSILTASKLVMVQEKNFKEDLIQTHVHPSHVVDAEFQPNESEVSAATKCFQFQDD